MNRRQRKKAHVGEFREYGFVVKGELKSPSDEDRFFDKFASGLESEELVLAGGIGKGFEFYVTPAIGSATEAHRAYVQELLGKLPEVQQFTVGELTDAWYGSTRA